MSCTGIHTTATPLSMSDSSCRVNRLLACQEVPGGEERKLPERAQEGAQEPLLHLREGDLASEPLAQARDPELLYAAGGYTVEPGEIRVHVKGEAVGGDPARGELDADGRYLILPHPHAGVLGVAPPLEAVLGEDPDQDVFQAPQVAVRVAVFEAQDGVADDLARPVEGRVPSPVAPEHLGPERPQVLLPRPEVRPVPGRPTHRVDRRVLAEDEGAQYLVSLPPPRQVPLQVPRLRVGRQTRQTPHPQRVRRFLLLLYHEVSPSSALQALSLASASAIRRFTNSPAAGRSPTRPAAWPA